MNKKYCPLKEANIEKGVIDVFKQKIERKKQEYLRFSLSRSYQNKIEENIKREECNINNNNNRKLIYIETFDTHDKYILNMYDEENKTYDEESIEKEEERNDITYKSSETNIKGRNEETVYIPLQILSNRYNYNDLVEATNNFSDENKIAKGGNGTVYKGILKNCINVAIKVLKKNENNGFENEIIIMSRYRHKNILCLLGYATNKDYFYLIYEYANSGDLRTLLFNHCYFYNSPNKEILEASYSSVGCEDKFISKNNYSYYSNRCFFTDKHNSIQRSNFFKNFQYQNNIFENDNPLFLSFSIRVNILVQIINVLCYLHTSSPIVYHRDLKSANILIDEKFNAKLGDFGLSFVYVNNNNIFNLTGGTPGYADPYYISTHEINEQTEVYSFGALILEMLTSKSPAIHVGKNYNCIYNKNEKCPIYYHKQKNELDENVFDYLVNHINMNDYKSIYSVLDHSVHFPDFLIEKLTKLSFLCLNPDIKSRPSSKLVNLILLEIQKESDFFIKKQKENFKTKVNNINLHHDEYGKEKYENNISINCSNYNDEKKYVPYDKYNNVGNYDLKNEKIKNKEYYKKIKNYSIYINQIKEINYNTLRQIFYKYIHPLFRNDKFYNLNKDAYKNVFSECTWENRNSEVGNMCLNNKELTYTNFKCNTISNVYNLKDFFFGKPNKDAFNKLFFFNPFSFNLMNFYFFRFAYEYFKNYNFHISNNLSPMKNHKYFQLKSYNDLFYSHEENHHKSINCVLKKKNISNYGKTGNDVVYNKKNIKKMYNMKLGNNDNNNSHDKFSNEEKDEENKFFISEHDYVKNKIINNHFYYHHMNNKNNIYDKYCYNITSINNNDFLKKSHNDMNNNKNNAIFMNKSYINNKYNNLYCISDHRNTYSEYIDSIKVNNHNNTYYENVNNYKDIKSKTKNENSGKLSNKGMNEEERNNIYSKCNPFNDSYNLHHLKDEKNILSSNFCTNKWPLKRNCRDDTPQMIFNIREENGAELKEPCINNKKKIMRISISIDEDRIANNYEKYRNGLKKENNSPQYNIDKNKSLLKNYNPFKKENCNDTIERNTLVSVKDIKESNVIYISNFINFINFDKNKNINDFNIFSWFNKNIFEIKIDEDKIVSDVSFLDILYEFNIFNFKRHDAKMYQNKNENNFFLNGTWVDYNKNENTFTSVNGQSNFFFEIAVYHDDVNNIHNVFLLKSNQIKDFESNQSKGATKKIWISDYIGRRNEFVEKILKKKISNILYECISRKHCLFLLEVQMKTLNKPSCYDHKIKGNFLYYYFEYNIKVLCNSDNCIFSNNYVLHKNKTYSYSLSNNILSLLVFSEDKIIKEMCQYKNSTMQQRIHFPLYPFFVNINFYNEK